MKRAIQDSNFVTIQGWMVNHLHLTSDEAIVFALICGYKDGFREPISYIAAWIGKSEDTVRRILRRLVSAKLLSEEVAQGKPTAYKVVANCNPPQIATPCTGATPPPANCNPLHPIINNINNINNTDSCVRTRELTESVSQFLEIWNSQPSLAACAALSKTDTVNLQRIVSEWGWARVRDVVAYAAATPTLNGTSASGFQACAAWFLKPERFAEIATAAERAALRGNAQAEKEAYAQRQLEIEKAEQKRLNEARERAAASAVPMPDECENLKRLFTKNRLNHNETQDHHTPRV